MVKRLLILFSILFLLSACIKVKYASPYISSAAVGSDMSFSSLKFLSLDNSSYIDFDFSYTKFAFFEDMQYIVSNQTIESIKGIEGGNINYKTSREYYFGFVAYAMHEAYKRYGCHEFLYPHFVLKNEILDNSSSFLNTDRKMQVKINVRGFCIKLKRNDTK